MFIFRILGSFQILMTSLVMGLLGFIVLTNAQTEPSAEKIKKYQTMIDEDTKIPAVIMKSSEFELSGAIQAHSFTHRYTFSIDSIEYEGIFTSKNSYAGKDSVWVYYDKDNPTYNTRNPWAEVAQERSKKSSPKLLLFALTMILLGGGGCVLSVLGLMKNK